MVRTSLPFQELLGDNRPVVVLDLMSGTMNAALAMNIDTFHPNEIVVGRGARVNIYVNPGLKPHALTTAPEIGRTGATEATLVFAVGALGTIAAKLKVRPPPRSPEAHRVWQQDIRTALGGEWAEEDEGERAAALIVDCLARDPADRPTARKVLHTIRTLDLPWDQGLVKHTGHAAPTLDRTPAPASNRASDYSTPPVGAVAPRREPLASLSPPPTSLVAPPPAVRSATSDRTRARALMAVTALLFVGGVGAASAAALQWSSSDAGGLTPATAIDPPPAPPEAPPDPHPTPTRATAPQPDPTQPPPPDPTPQAPGDAETPAAEAPAPPPEPVATEPPEKAAPKPKPRRSVARDRSPQPDPAPAAPAPRSGIVDPWSGEKPPNVGPTNGATDDPDRSEIVDPWD